VEKYDLYQYELPRPCGSRNGFAIGPIKRSPRAETSKVLFPRNSVVGSHVSATYGAELSMRVSDGERVLFVWMLLPAASVPAPRST
jgi:hypothetical protein